MAVITLQNQSGAPDSPPTDHVRIYPYGDGLYWKDDAGNVYEVVKQGAGTVYITGDATTDDSWRVTTNGDGDLVFEKRVSGDWVTAGTMTA